MSDQTNHEFFCPECKLSATSKTVLDAHLKGNKHAKEIKKLKILQESKLDPAAEIIKCHVCDIELNSAQQYVTHKEGNRHKKKLAKGDWTGKEIVSKCNEVKEGKESEDVEMPLVPISAPLLLCEPCNKFFNSQSQMNGHLESAKHLKKASLLKKKNRSKNDNNHGFKVFKKRWQGKKKGIAPYKLKSHGATNNDRPPAPSFFPMKNFISGGLQNF